MNDTERLARCRALVEQYRRAFVINYQTPPRVRSDMLIATATLIDCLIAEVGSDARPIGVELLNSMGVWPDSTCDESRQSK